MRSCDDGYPSCRYAEATGEWCKGACKTSLGAKAQAVAFIRYGEITSDHVRAAKLNEIQGHIDQINSYFSACAMRFDRAAAMTDADIDRHLELIRAIARGLEPPSTACR